MNKQGFILKVCHDVINLLTLIHGYSYLISLEMAVDYKKVRSFQGTQVNLSGLLEKEISRNHRGTFNTEFVDLSCRSSPKT